MDPAKETEVELEYMSSLMDLNVNSKPLINMLTMLADENIECAHDIVRAVEKHLAKVQPEVKLPILYLIDSIVKNVGNKYKQLFAQNIVNMFCSTFEKVNEKVREKMFNLRQTWNDVFPQTKLYALDVKVNLLDNNWPITAKIKPKSVHVNPNFLGNQPTAQQPRAAPDLVVKQLQDKKRQLEELEQRKIELELMMTKKKIAESTKELQLQRGLINPHNIGQPPSGPSTSMPSNFAVQQHHTIPHHTRIKIAPPNAAMIASARSRDPRLMRTRQHQPNSSAQDSMQRATQQVLSLGGNLSTKSLPRIPKFSQANNHIKTSRDNDERERDRDPRSRRKEESSNLKATKSSPSSKDRSKTSKASSSSVRSSDRKNGSSDDGSPRKKSEDEKKSKGSSSHRTSSSKSPTKHSINEAKDIDLRILPSDMSSTSSIKSNKDKLLSDLLNGEEIKSSHDASDNEEMELSPKRDTDLRFTEGGKKRSLSNEPGDNEPTNKKNRADTDLLFGNKDVDLRTLGEAAQSGERKSKSKEKADFEAVRAKLNATKDKMKRGGIKLLDEIPAMPASENGNVELVKKILSRKEKVKEVIEEESRDEPLEVSPPTKQQKLKQNSTINDERIEEVEDLGNLTAAELRKTSIVPASIRRDSKRKNSKWSEPTTQWPMQTNNRPPGLPPGQFIMPQHFINPWESNPMVQAMQKQTQMPLVVPISVTQLVLNNKMRTLRLDGTKDHLLRFYNETAIIFNDSGEPHDIKFSSGQSRVIIDDKFTADLNFNDVYKPIFIESNLHQIKFGSPTRELYIDNHYYECYFNNQPTQIALHDKVRFVRIEGNAPEVKIGRKRSDLVLGRIYIVIDAEMMVPVFLDTTTQYFEYKGKIFTLQFADFFLSVVINNEPFRVEYGGLPKNFTIFGTKHFIRFTGFPDHLSPGKVNMVGMKRTHLFKNCKSPPLIEPLEPLEGVDIGQLVEYDMRIQPPQNDGQMMIQPTPLAPNIIPGIGHEAQGAPVLGVNFDINDLLKKLVADGVIGGTAAAPTSSSNNNSKKDNKSPDRVDESRKTRNHHDDRHRTIYPVSLSKPETIKKRQQPIVETLYSGIQCSSCGLRFPPEQTMKYSQHLDWHFRQNRRERDSKRRAHFRKWYYNQSDWIKYEEIEDLEEREKNFFETQQMESMMEQGDDSSSARAGNLEGEGVSCPTGPDDTNRCCDMCHDQFEQFFNEETEEWHLRSAMKIDDKFYHPICYEDFKTSQTLDESGFQGAMQKTDEDDSDMPEIIVKVEQDAGTDNQQQVQRTDDDDDDVIVLPTEAPIVTEILDESEVNEGNVTKETESCIVDDDVMIQEPKIETQLVLDDDDDYQPNPSTSEDKIILKIKEEPKDDGYEDLVNEEDAFVEVTAIANDDLMQDDAYTNSPKAPFQPAQDENAMFDDSSLMIPSPNNADDLGDDENNSRPETSGPALIGGNKKLKIVLSSLAQTNLSNKNLNTNSNVNDQNENSLNLDSVNKFDSNSVELQTGERKDQPGDVVEDIEHEVKLQLRGVKFEKNMLPVRRGLENSGLCSIM